MDIYDLVTFVVNREAQAEKILLQLHGRYLFSDNRPGTPAERLDQDAAQFAEISKAYERRQGK
jgi:hypothetical protein